MSYTCTDAKWCGRVSGSLAEIFIFLYSRFVSIKITSDYCRRIKRRRRRRKRRKRQRLLLHQNQNQHLHQQKKSHQLLPVPLKNLVRLEQVVGAAAKLNALDPACFLCLLRNKLPNLKRYVQMPFQRYTSNYPKICHRTANYTVKLHYQMLAASVTAVSAKRNEISRCISFYGKDK